MCRSGYNLETQYQIIFFNAVVAFSSLVSEYIHYILSINSFEDRLVLLNFHIIIDFQWG